MKKNSKKAFTLAEILIVIGVIGVVAALTIPTLMAEINDRINSEKHVRIVQKVTQAMEQMKVEGYLGKFENTEAFADVFQRYIKVLKRCDSDHLTECWPTAKVTNSANKFFNVADAKTGDKLGFPARTGNKNVGFILADGTPIIMSYNPDSNGVGQYELSKASSITLPYGNGKNKEFKGYTTNVTSGLAFVTDVNGAAEPNRETVDGKFNDIRSFNGANFSSVAEAQGECSGFRVDQYCVVHIDSYEPARCMFGTTEPYCGKIISGSATDYWAGAMKACMDIGMSLPSKDVLTQIVVKGGEGVPTSGNYWVSDEQTTGYARAGSGFINFASGLYTAHNIHKIDKYASSVLCVSQ